MSAPIWFGPSENPLFGWLHVPSGATAAVVLCPPIGVQALVAYGTYRLLAQALEERGVATLRFDYTGTGNSARALAEVDGVGTWLADIGAADTYLRELGFTRIGRVGMRFGATLAANAASGSGLDALVLWDPCESGRPFLREQRVLAATGRGPDRPDTTSEQVEIPGMLLSGPLAKEIAALSLPPGEVVLAERVLVLSREGKAPGPTTMARIASGQWVSGLAVGQPELLDVIPGGHLFPLATIEEISRWLSEALAALTGALAVAMATMSWRPVVFGSGAERISETPVSIGPLGLFGILTEPVAESVPIAPAVVLFSAGVLPHTGPARFWVELARSWAQHGLRVLRVDLSGLGDSPAHPGRKRELSFPPEALDDVTAICRFLDQDDPSRVILAGLCSGAYHAIEGALLLGSKKIWLLNPAQPPTSEEPEADNDHAAWRQADQSLNRVTASLFHDQRLARWCRRFMPVQGWWALDRLGILALPSRPLEALVALGTDIRVLCGPIDSVPYLRRAPATLRRLARTGRFSFGVIDSMDHALFVADARRQVADYFRDQVLPTLALPSMADAAGRGLAAGVVNGSG